MYRFLYFRYILQQVDCLYFTRYQKSKISPTGQNTVAHFRVCGPVKNHILLQYLFQHFASSHQTRNFITLSISKLRKTSLQLVILTGEGVHPITHQHSVTWRPSSCGNNPCILQGKQQTNPGCQFTLVQKLLKNRN